MVLITKLDPEVIKMCRPLILDDDAVKKIMHKFSENFSQSLKAEKCQNTPVKCNLTHVDYFPDGSEKESFIGLDFSGKVFRIAHITLRGDFDHNANVTKLYQFPEHRLSEGIVKTMDYVAKCVSDFIESSGINDEKIILGVASSFPIVQESVHEGTLVQWSRDFTSPELSNENMFHQLKMSLKKFKFSKNVYLISLVSSATACLLSGIYQEPHTRVGFYLGDTINLTYIERFKNMTIYKGDDIRTRTALAVDIKNFGDDGCLDFIRTDFDAAVDESSPNKGKALLEKLVAGAYVGEIVRLCLVELASLGAILNGYISDKLSTKNSIKTSDVSFMEQDKENVYYRCKAVMHFLGYQDITDEDCIQIRFVSRCIAKRSANIVGACLSALIYKMESRHVRIVADGLLIKEFPNYINCVIKKINQLVRPELGFRIVLAAKEEVAMGAGVVASIYKKAVIKAEEKFRSLPLFNTTKYSPLTLPPTVGECECDTESVCKEKKKSFTEESFKDDSSISRVFQVSEPIYVNPLYTQNETEP